MVRPSLFLFAFPQYSHQHPSSFLQLLRQWCYCHPLVLALEHVVCELALSDLNNDCCIQAFDCTNIFIVLTVVEAVTVGQPHLSCSCDNSLSIGCVDGCLFFGRVLSWLLFSVYSCRLVALKERS